MILVIDNYDSFVHNLARYFRLLGCETSVVRNDQVTISQIRKLQPDAIVLSPGPCNPDHAGICLSIVDQLQTEFPVLGVCLGHQVIVQALGGNIVRSSQPMHGRSSLVQHDGSDMFKGVANPFSVGRYHSLVGQANSLPAELCASAKTGDTIMAIQHCSLPVVGFQFHPESILTESGFQLISNFLSLAKIKHADDQVVTLEQQQRAGKATAFDRPYSISSRLTVRPDR